MTVYAPAFAGSNLYSVVTEAHGRKQLDQSHYAVMPYRGTELVIS